MTRSYDVVIVGARVAGASLGALLSERGLSVAVVDRAGFPSDTMSTHVVYPNTLARLDRLGVLGEILDHGPPPLYTAWHHDRRTFVAPHTPVDGRDWALCVRRITLDAILLERARKAGADVLERFRVTGLIGSGSDDDPVRGVVGVRDGQSQELHARLVVGADGAASSVARILRIERERELASGVMMLYAYWRGLPERNLQEFFFEPPWVATHFPADDGYSVVIVMGPIDLWSAQTKDEVYRRRLEATAALGARLRDGTQVSGVIGTRRLDGFYRQATGPGWVLTGDAGHFKHPAAVQGIADALHASEVLAPLIAEQGGLAGFEPWRDATTRQMYAFSRFLGSPPSDEVMAATLQTAIADPSTARALVDIWSREHEPWAVLPRIPAMLDAAGHLPTPVA